MTRYLNFRILLIFLVVFSSISLASANELETSERIAPPLPKLARIKIDAKSEAEVLLRKTRVVVDEKFFSRSVSYVAVYINSDEAARDYSQISVGFNSFYEDIVLDFANVRTSDGKIHKIQADATQIQNLSDENFYQDQKELLFSLPNVRKGSVIEFQYSYTDIKKIMPSAWFDGFGFHWWEDRAAGQGGRADKVHLSELEIITPEQMPLYFNDAKVYGAVLSTSHKKSQQHYFWRVKNLPDVKLQDYMQRDHQYAAYVRVGTEKNWQAVAQWAENLISPHLKIDEKMQVLINEINRSSATPEEKVKAVYTLMQKEIRYVFAHVGRGGYEPHDAAEVLKNGYGDCKDQSVFVVTLLRALGIQASPALIATRSRGIPDMSIPAVTFDHMIVYIPKQTGLNEIWMDTTGDASLYPGFSIGIEGQPALVVGSQTKAIQFLPSLAPQSHNVNFKLTFDKLSGKNAEASFEIDFGGMYEQRLRSMWQYTPDREKYFRDFLKNMYPSAEIIELKAINADSLWNGFHLVGRFRFSNAWGGNKESIEYGFNIIQLANLFADLRNFDKPENRKQIFELNPGYSINSTIQFKRPGLNHKLRLISQGENIENRFYKLQQSGREVAQGYQIQQELLINSVNLSISDYKVFHQKIDQLLETPDWSLRYDFSSSDAVLSAVKQSGKSVYEQQIAIIRLHIRNGEYASALKLAEEAVLQKPESGEMWYLLGLAQGYNNLLEDSDRSFHKAEFLGYEL